MAEEITICLNFIYVQTNKSFAIRIPAKQKNITLILKTSKLYNSLQS